MKSKTKILLLVMTFCSGINGYPVVFALSKWLSYFSRDLPVICLTGLAVVVVGKKMYHSLELEHQLKQAFKNEDILLMKQLIEEKGADVNVIVYGRSLLKSAVEDGQGEILELLIENNVNFDREKKDMLLGFAVKHNNTKTIDLLLKAGIDINTVDETGWGALMSAVRIEDEDQSVAMMDYLIEKGININQILAQSSEPTVLLKAANDLSYKKVKLLLDNGADLKATSNIRKENALMKALIASGKKNINQDDLLKIIQALLDKKIDVNAKDMFGQTALHLAVYYKRGIAVFELLFKNGIDVNAKDLSNWTALTHAIPYYNEEIVKLLLVYGAEDSVVQSSRNNSVSQKNIQTMMNNIDKLVNLDKSETWQQMEKLSLLEEDKSFYYCAAFNRIFNKEKSYSKKLACLDTLFKDKLPGYFYYKYLYENHNNVLKHIEMSKDLSKVDLYSPDINIYYSSFFNDLPQ